MIVYIENEASPQTFARVEALVAASCSRDIELQGVEIRVLRDDYTWVDSSGDPYVAAAVHHALQAEISGERTHFHATHNTTIFGNTYDK